MGARAARAGTTRRRRRGPTVPGQWWQTVGSVVTYIGLLAFVMSLYPLPGLLQLRARDDDLHRNGIRTPAVVVGIEEGTTVHARPGGGRRTYSPRTEQEIDGHTTTKTWEAYATTQQGVWTTGTRSTVRYDRTDPGRMVIDASDARALTAHRIASAQVGALRTAGIAAVGLLLLGIREVRYRDALRPIRERRRRRRRQERRRLRREREQRRGERAAGVRRDGRGRP